MTKKHHDDGPSFSAAPPKRNKPADAPSPVRQRIELEQTARDCAKTRAFNKAMREDPSKALQMLGLLKK